MSRTSTPDTNRAASPLRLFARFQLVQADRRSSRARGWRTPNGPAHKRVSLPQPSGIGCPAETDCQSPSKLQDLPVACPWRVSPTATPRTVPVGYRHRLHDQCPQSSPCIFRMPSGCLQVALRSAAQALYMSQMGVERRTLAVLFSGAGQRVIDDASAVLAAPDWRASQEHCDLANPRTCLRTGTSDRGSNDHP